MLRRISLRILGMSYWNILGRNSVGILGRIIEEFSKKSWKKYAESIERNPGNMVRISARILGRIFASITTWISELIIWRIPGQEESTEEFLGKYCKELLKSKGIFKKEKNPDQIFCTVLAQISEKPFKMQLQTKNLFFSICFALSWLHNCEISS